MQNSKTAELDKNFVVLTEEIKQYLSEVKSRFDAFDLNHPSRQDRIDHLNENKNSIYAKLTEHFDNVWELVRGLDKDKYQQHRNYYQGMLLPYF